MNLDRVARNIIQTTVSDGYISRVMKYITAKEMWKTLALISQGTGNIKENKLSKLLREIETQAMKPSENIEQL